MDGLGTDSHDVIELASLRRGADGRTDAASLDLGERLDYIADLTAELSAIAAEVPHCQTLAGLLGLAHHEARLRRGLVSPSLE